MTIPLTLGTAGHIDHGKTSLIRALTGTDTDRLPQERDRGISIELGYAELSLPSGRCLSVVDVPGHERFVRTMVAGASGIDLCLMVIAADDGPMPQTREHAAVLRALGVEVGVVAVTKADRADPALAAAAARDLFPRAETISVSARSGAGLDSLRAALGRAAAAAVPHADRTAAARLHVDRVFTIRGAGTVATGTLWSGALHRGDTVRILPAARTARIRGLQIHDRAVDTAPAGQRVAVNLTGVSTGELDRGDVVAASDSTVEPTYRLDCELELDPKPDDQDTTRVQVHHGTRETPARLSWLGGRFWQLRLEQPLLAQAGDRVVVRRIAPPDTLGGGRVLDPAPQRHGPGRELTARLSSLSRGERPSDPAAGGVTLPLDSRTQLRRERRPLSASAIAAEERLRAAGLEPPSDTEFDPADLEALRDAGTAVRVAKGLHMHPEAIAAARERLVAAAQANDGRITLAEARDVLRTSRKFAQAVVEHLDSERTFVRRGDAHVLRRLTER